MKNPTDGKSGWTGWFRALWNRFAVMFSRADSIESLPDTGVFSVRNQNGFCVLCFPNGEVSIHPGCLRDAGVSAGGRGTTLLNPATAERLALGGLESVRCRMDETLAARNKWGQAPIRRGVVHRQLEELRNEDGGLRRALIAARREMRSGSVARIPDGGDPVADRKDGEAAQVL